mgnify:FL=1
MKVVIVGAGNMGLAMAAYMTIGVKFHNERLMRFAFKIRYPKLIAMIITAFTIGGASIVFQSVINNTIVTPCLLGMNSLYTLIHTAVVFFLGSGSMLVINANISFALDLVIMGVVAKINPESSINENIQNSFITKNIYEKIIKI